MKKVTYKDAGVDIVKEGKAVEAIINELKPSLPGHFSGLVEFGEHYLSLCTDGVGSKVMVAEALKKYDTIGIDMVAMNVNDVICVGATPLALVDYLAVNKINVNKIKEIMKGVSKGAKEAGVDILGGETATLPELINGFDLAGTCLGYVRKNEVITGKSIKEGDVIIGIESSGVHSNGFTLVRKVLDPKKWGSEMLTPTIIYVKDIMAVLGKHRGSVHGLAHITGGGLLNIKRIFPENLGAEIDYLPEPKPIFKAIQKAAKVNDKEMYTTFNMGIGFCLVVDPKKVSEIQSIIKHKTYKIGKIVPKKRIKVMDKFVL